MSSQENESKSNGAVSAEPRGGARELDLFSNSPTFLDLSGTQVEFITEYTQGRMYLEISDFSAASRRFQAAREIIRNHVLCNLSLAKSLMYLDNHREAEIIFSEIDQIYPEDPRVKLGRALNIRFSEPHRARRLLNDALSSDKITPSDVVRVENQLGLIERDLEHLRESGECHKRALLVQPKDVVSLYCSGIIYLLGGASDEGKSLILKSYKLAKEASKAGQFKNMWYDTIRWTVFQLDGNFKEAEEMRPALMNAVGSRYVQRVVNSHVEAIEAALILKI